jgi:addiction module HigA family antidote
MIKNMIHLDKNKKQRTAYEVNLCLNENGETRLPPTELGKYTGYEIDYRKFDMHSLALKLGLTDTELNDVLDDKRSFWPVDVIEEGCNLIPNNRMPFEPTHPGRILKREIQYRELDLAELAQQMGISLTELTEILDCKRPVTEEYAGKFEAALDLSAATMRGLQADYDIEAVLIPLRNLRRLQNEKRKKQQQKRVSRTLPLQEWQPRRQSVPVPQRVAAMEI